MEEPTAEYSIESQLKDRLVAGDTDALASAFSLHFDRLRRGVAFRMDNQLRGRVDPDDILQEAFLEARTRLDNFASLQETHAEQQSPISLFVWLRLIVGQTMVNVHRRHLGTKMRDARREVGPMAGPAPVATHVSLVDRLLGHLTSPSQAAMRAELGEQLRTQLASMSENDQEIIALRHFEQMSNQEVAEALGIEGKAASIRYVRALKRLKSLLESLPPEARMNMMGKPNSGS